MLTPFTRNLLAISPFRAQRELEEDRKKGKLIGSRNGTSYEAWTTSRVGSPKAMCKCLSRDGTMRNSPATNTQGDPQSRFRMSAGFLVAGG